MICALHAPVAQLDRVLGYEPRGRGFESCRAHQFYQANQGIREQAHTNNVGFFSPVEGCISPGFPLDSPKLHQSNPVLDTPGFPLHEDAVVGPEPVALRLSR